MQLLVVLSRGDPLRRGCRQHGQGVMPEKSEKAAGVREEGCERVSRGVGWGLRSSAEGLCKAPEGTSSSHWAEQPAPKWEVPKPHGAGGTLLLRDGDAAGIRHASPAPRLPFEVLLNQMLVEILQL